jgi:adenine-specific DNA-methyltransferase
MTTDFKWGPANPPNPLLHGRKGGWAVGFDWQPGQPFRRDWQDYRTRKDRSLKTVSDAGHVYDKSGKHAICVKVVDVFGCDTSIVVDVNV